MANQFLGLSLFIMLLSFFIILNSLSDFEVKKSSPVLNSLSLAFSMEEKKDNADSNQKSEIQAARKGTTLDKLQGLFTAQIAGVEGQQNRLGTTMHLRMPYQDFEEQITASLLGRPAGQEAQSLGDDFTKTLISLLDTKEAGQMYKMHMVVDLPDEPTVVNAKNKPVYQEASSGISRIAGILEQAGLDKKLLTTGLQAGQEGMVNLFFLRYEPFNPFAGQTRSEGGS